MNAKLNAVQLYAQDLQAVATKAAEGIAAFQKALAADPVKALKKIEGVYLEAARSSVAKQILDEITNGASLEIVATALDQQMAHIASNFSAAQSCGHSLADIAQFGALIHLRASALSFLAIERQAEPPTA